MKLPKRPPDITSVFQATDRDRLTKIFAEVQDSLVDGKYLHWEELLRRKVPSDLSHEEWWMGLKFKRNARKATTLLDTDGVEFRYGVSDPIPEQLHFIDLGAGGRIEMPEQITNPETKDQYYISSLIEEAVTSSQLEGATTTRPVAKSMIKEGRDPVNRSERMILNNYLTMKEIGKLKDEALSTDLVYHIHKLVTQDTLDDPSAAGRLRSMPVVVGDDQGGVFHIPPPPKELHDRLEKMCRFANCEAPEGFLHPTLRSIILHFWLGYDHPFVDGNGRTARALFYWSMLRNGFWLCEYISISQILIRAPTQYSRSFLYTETDGNDLTYFLIYHLEVICRSIRELHEYITRKSAQLQSLETNMRGLATFNHRQRELLSHALRHPYHRYTIQSHQTSHNVVYQTARTDLQNLEQKGLFESKRIGNKLNFYPKEDLTALLVVGSKTN